MRSSTSTPDFIDPDGSGGNPPQGVSLAWTERLAGDYDQNGEVNAADLVPIAQHFKAMVQYDAAVLHGGFAEWPAGDPGSGAADDLNWRKARVDGDRNGEINQAEVTVIAQRWKQGLAGYRVYRQAPGEAGFTLLPDPADLGSPLTAPKPADRPPLAPVQYSFPDPQASAGGLGNGVYQFYVAPYDSVSGQEGPPSPAVSIDTATGSVNLAPSAELSVTPDYDSARAEIAFDAAGSYDLDGSLAEFAWDINGDGTVDYRSTDPAPPAGSSSGAAGGITPGAQPGQLTATFIRGSADYYHPTVRVTDNGGLTSLAAKAQLGISGWASEPISTTDSVPELAQSKVEFQVTAMDIDPQTGQPCVAGFQSAQHGLYNGPEPTYDLHVAWHNQDGSWTQEQTGLIGSPAWTSFDPPFGGPSAGFYMLRATNGNLLLFNTETNQGLGGITRGQIVLSERLGPGNWKHEIMYSGEGPERNVSGAFPVVTGSGRIACLFYTLPALDTIPIDVLYYDNGEISMEGLELQAGMNIKSVPRTLISIPGQADHFLINYALTEGSNGLGFAWLAGSTGGTWQEESHLWSGPTEVDRYETNHAFYGPGGKLYLETGGSGGSAPPYQYETAIFSWNGSQLERIFSLPYDLSHLNHATCNEEAVAKFGWSPDREDFYFFRIEGQSVYDEFLFTERNLPGDNSFGSAASVQGTGQEHYSIGGLSTTEGNLFNFLQTFWTRVDPRQ